MAKITYVLRNVHSTTETPVNLIFRDGNQRTTISTGERIHPKYWDEKKGLAKQTKKFPRYPEFNQHLTNLETRILDIYRRLVNDGEFQSIKQVREIYNREINGDGPKDKLSFWQFLERFITVSEGKLNKSTLKTYKTTKRTLKEYEQYKGKKTTFEGITLEWYESYIDYLTNVCDYSPNTHWQTNFQP